MDDTMRKRLALVEELMRDGELDATAAAVLVLTKEVEALRDKLEWVSEGIGNIRR